MGSMMFEGRNYATKMGSHVDRDGMFLELDDVTGGGLETVAEWFYSDADGSMTFSACRLGLPSAVLEWFKIEAGRRLPPIGGAT